MLGLGFVVALAASFAAGLVAASPAQADSLLIAVEGTVKVGAPVTLLISGTTDSDTSVWLYFRPEADRPYGCGSNSEEHALARLPVIDGQPIRAGISFNLAGRMVGLDSAQPYRACAYLARDLNAPPTAAATVLLVPPRPPSSSSPPPQRQGQITITLSKKVVKSGTSVVIMIQGENPAGATSLIAWVQEGLGPCRRTTGKEILNRAIEEGDFHVSTSYLPKRAEAFRVCAFLGWWTDVGGRLPVSTVFKASDGNRPTVRAVASYGTVGTKSRLYYFTSDDSGRTREKLSIYQHGRLLRTLRTRLQKSLTGKRYTLAWLPSARTRGVMSFCVTAWDATGNQSKPGCARLEVRAKWRCGEPIPGYKITCGEEAPPAPPPSAGSSLCTLGGLVIFFLVDVSCGEARNVLSEYLGGHTPSGDWACSGTAYGGGRCVEGYTGVGPLFEWRPA